MANSPSNQVLVTVSGPDAPGITSELTGILAESDATILDIGQAVIHGLLSLSILVALNPQDSDKAVLKNLLFKATELGLKLDFQVIPQSRASKGQLGQRPHRYAITLIADQVTAKAVHEVTACLVTSACNIDVIQRLSEDEFSCVEFLTSSSRPIDEISARKKLLEITKAHGVDIALQSEGLFRKAKRLVVMDMDSTLIQNEVIDEFARHMGKYDEVAKITHEAMKGNVGFEEALKKRCGLLKGLKQEDIDNVYQSLKLTHGARELISVLKKLGYKVALISGGFTCVADRFKTELGIDYAFANTMKMNDGVFTGEILPPIVTAQRKADLLEGIAQQEGITTDQVIAIGDGANDLLMLERAGLGIAFNAKAAVREQADLALNQKNLRSVFYLLGISQQDLKQAL